MAGRSFGDWKFAMQVFKADKKSLYTVAFTPDGRSLLTAAPDRVRRWSVPDGELLDEWSAPPHWSVVAISPDGGHIAIGGERFSLRSIDGALLVDEEWFTQQISFTTDGSYVFAAGQGHPLAGWVVEDGFEFECGWGGDRSSTGGTRFPVGAVVCHPTADCVAVSFGESSGTARGFDSRIDLFDDETGESTRTIVVHHRFEHVTRLKFTTDARFLIGLNGPMWRVWSLDDDGSEPIASATCGRKHLQDLALSPDGSRMVTVGNDTNVRVWSTADWSEVNGFEWDIGPLTCVAVSPDGTLYAAGSRKGKVVLWDDWPS